MLVAAVEDVDSAPAQVLDLALLQVQVVVVPVVLALAGVARVVLPQRAVLPRLPLLAVLVVALAAEEEAEALVELLSRQSFSAAMARSTT